MKELLKVVSKKLFIWSIIFNTLYSFADYGQAFALSYFGTSPLTLDKVIKLTIAIIVMDIITLITCKVAAYIDNINDIKSKNIIQKYYFNKLQNMTMEKIANTHTGYIHNFRSFRNLYVFYVVCCDNNSSFEYWYDFNIIYGM